MTIELTEQIDIITISEETGRIYLTISDHLRWDHPDKLLVLQHKLNHYLAFIESGQIALQHPQAAILNPVISLISQFPADQLGEQFLTTIRSIIEEAGYSFEWKSFDTETNQLVAQQG